MSKVYPLILSGGSGARLWPLSRESFPKQFLSLTGDESLLQQTALRVRDPVLFHPITVVANQEHRFVIAEQLREAGVANAQIILEPVARDTAAAVAVAALFIGRSDPDAVLLVLPADHAISAPAAFRAAISARRSAAAAGRLVLFGISPDHPAADYGYIQPGPAGADGLQPVQAFVEKPDAVTAQQNLAQGWFWNSGMVLASAKVIIAELAQYAPQVLSAAQSALEASVRDLDFLRLDAEQFALSPTISLDRAVIEHSRCAVMTVAGFGWRDVDGWPALWDLGPSDGDGNQLLGDVAAMESRDCYLRSEGPLVATLGVRDLIVVATADAVLVAERAQAQDVKRLVEHLVQTGRGAALQTRRTYRPWGWFESLQAGARFQVKQISVKPQGRLSLQKHAHRAEHWVVVSGVADVDLNGETHRLVENQSIYIPLGAVHRLSNAGEAPLHVVEIQSGDYLGEDDIVRLEDIYART